MKYLASIMYVLKEGLKDKLLYIGLFLFIVGILFLISANISEATMIGNSTDYM